MNGIGQHVREIDWERARERLRRAALAVEQADQRTPDEVRARLKANAERFAAPPQAPLGDALEIIRFDLAEERFAVETAFVREILRARDFTPIPGAPDFVLGVINLRGQLVAVMDLARLLDLHRSNDASGQRVIVLGQEQIEFGILADAVHDVAKLPLDRLCEPPVSLNGITRGFIRGVTVEQADLAEDPQAHNLGGQAPEVRLILDGAALLIDSRLFIDLDDAAPGGEGGRS